MCCSQNITQSCLLLSSALDGPLSLPEIATLLHFSFNHGELREFMKCDGVCRVDCLVNPSLTTDGLE
jgi:hypothetical protein